MISCAASHARAGCCADLPLVACMVRQVVAEEGGPTEEAAAPGGAEQVA